MYRSEKWARKIFETSDENHGLTRFKICKFFDYSKMSFLWTKKPPCDKTTWSNDKTKVFCTDQISVLERDLKLLSRNKGLPVLKYANFSTIVKGRFYGRKSLLLTKQHDQRTKPKSLEQKSRPARYLELMTRIMG